RGVLPVVARDQRATRVAFGYVRDYVADSPLLAKMLEAEPLAFELRPTKPAGRDVVSVHAALYPSLQHAAGIMDGLGFYRLEGLADSDAEIQASIRRCSGSCRRAWSISRRPICAAACSSRTSNGPGARTIPICSCGGRRLR